MDFTELHDEDETEERDAARRRPGGCLRGLLRLALVLLAPLLLALALAPTLLSSDAGRRWALAKINAAAAPAAVSFERWSLGWFSAPALEKVTYRDEARGLSLQAERVAFDRGLLRLLPFGVLNLGRVTLVSPALELALPPAETEPAAAGPRPAAGAGGGFFLPVADFAAEVCITNGSASVSGRAAEAFRLRQADGTVTLESVRRPIAVRLQAQVGGGAAALEGRVQSLRELFEGGSFEKPETLTLKLSDVDLTAFGPLIEHAAGEPWIRSGVAEGVLTARVSGPEQVKVECGLLASGFSVAGGRQPPSPAGDLALLVDAGYDQRVLAIEKFEVSSPWLRANAKGTLRPGAQPGALAGALSARAESELAAVARDFGPLLRLSKGLAVQRGRLEATVEVAADEKAVAVDVRASAAELALTIDGAPLELKPAPSLTFKASRPTGGWPVVEAFRFQAPFADVSGSGRFDAASVKARLDLTRFSRDFKRILKDAPPMVGLATLDVLTRRAEERVSLSALLKLSDVAAELRPGQRLVVPQGALKAEGFAPLKAGRPEGEVQEASFEVTLESGRAAGGWARLALPQEGRPLVLRGFTLTSDLELGGVRRLLGGFLPAGAQRRLAEWQGRVLANATAEAANGAFKARLKAAGQEVVAGDGAGGVWRVPDARFDATLSQESAQADLRLEAELSGGCSLQRDGAAVFAEPAARLAADVRLAPDRGRARVEALALSSSLGELQAQADLTELATRCAVDAKGRLAVDFAALTRLLEARGVDEFQMTGRGLREFHFASPVAGGLATVFAEGAFTGSAYLGSLKGLGLDAGPADVSLKLARGALKAAYEPALNGGRLRLLPELSVERGAAVLSVPPRTRLLENVRLTQGMVDALLVNLNPLFQGSLVQEGSVTLDVAALQLASGRAPGTGVAADLSVQLSGLSLELGPTLRELLALLKVKERLYRVDKLPIHVVVRDGRIHVDPIRMVIDKQPVIFSGWVAFDGTIKYLIEVPLTDRATGGTAGRLLKGVVIKIPVAGTVDEPRLDTSALQSALSGLIQSAVGERAAERIGTFLERLQEELRK